MPVYASPYVIFASGELCAIVIEITPEHRVTMRNLVTEFASIRSRIPGISRIVIDDNLASSYCLDDVDDKVLTKLLGMDRETFSNQTWIEISPQQYEALEEHDWPNPMEIGATSTIADEEGCRLLLIEDAEHDGPGFSSPIPL